MRNSKSEKEPGTVQIDRQKKDETYPTPLMPTKYEVENIQIRQKSDGGISKHAKMVYNTMNKKKSFKRESGRRKVNEREIGVGLSTFKFAYNTRHDVIMK